MDVANAGGDGFDVTWPQTMNLPCRRQATIHGGVGLRQLSPAKDPDQTPHSMVMDRRGLTRSPYEAHHAEVLTAVAVQKVLPVAEGIGLRIRVRQPIIVGDQVSQ